MDIKLCENIVKYRKYTNTKQSSLAEFLGVTSQAVSKWEQGLSMPDVTLIPKIAFFFNISIDTLFGSCNIDELDLLVSRYIVSPNDSNYKSAKDTIDTILIDDPNNTVILKLQCKLEFNRSIEYIRKTEVICTKLKELARYNDKDLEFKANLQLIRLQSMLGKTIPVEPYKDKFLTTHSIDDLNYLILILGHNKQYTQVLTTFEQYIEDFSIEEQLLIYPNRMEAGFELNDLKTVLSCFDIITEYSTDKAQIFNAWWLLWKAYQKSNMVRDIERCKEKLLELLPLQGYNDYIYSSMETTIKSGIDNMITVL